MASTLNSSLELSRRLAASGHEVIYMSHVDLRERVEHFGYRFVLLRDCQEIQEQFSSDLNAARKRSSIFNIFRIIKLGLQARNKSASSNEIYSAIVDADPDVLLIDFEMHYAIFATHKLQIPTLLTAVWFTIFRSPGLPPMHTELRPSRDWGGRMKIKWAWWKLIAARMMEPIRSLTPRELRKRLTPIRYGANQRSQLKTVARAHDAPFSSMTSRTNWSKPHTYRDLDLLIFNANEMELEHPKHPLERYVGPMVCHERSQSRIGEKELARLETFLHSSKAKNQKLVYCSLGTFWSTDLSFLKKVIDAFRDREEWNLVIGLGGKAARNDFATTHPNVLIMDNAPQLKVLEQSDAAITHGGITTINECISFGVPMLVCSTGHVDQPGCAVRVEHHGLGQLLDIKSATSSAIEKQLDSLMRNDEIQNRVDAMRKVFQRYERDNEAVKLVESLTQAGRQ